MYKKSFLIGIIAASLLITSQAWAHATVKPNTTGIGKFQSFTLGVPSEKPIATVGVRLVLPDGLNYVTPNVKPGWKIDIKKQTSEHMMDDGKTTAETKVTEITWTGGSIPAEMRDEFLFSAQVPSQPTSLSWKVYQTYSDGSVVSWDQDPNAPQATSGHEDMNEETGPYSKTEVIDDLTATTSPEASTGNSNNSTATAALALSAVALAVAVARSKKQAK
jgi:uncharacterized protein YcnI